MQVELDKVHETCIWRSRPPSSGHDRRPI